MNVPRFVAVMHTWCTTPLLFKVCYRKDRTQFRQISEKGQMTDLWEVFSKNKRVMPWGFREIIYTRVNMPANHYQYYNISLQAKKSKEACQLSYLISERYKFAFNVLVCKYCMQVESLNKFVKCIHTITQAHKSVQKSWFDLKDSDYLSQK